MPDSAAQEGVYLSAGELSEVLAIGDVEISRLARRGVLPPGAGPGATALFPLPAEGLRCQLHPSLEVAGQVDRDLYWKARARYEGGKAHAIAAANALRDGRLVSTLDVESEQRELAHTLKQRLGVISGRIADAFAENGDRERIEQVVRAELSAALMAIGKP